MAFPHFDSSKHDSRRLISLVAFNSQRICVELSAFVPPMVKIIPTIWRQSLEYYRPTIFYSGTLPPSHLHVCA